MRLPYLLLLCIFILVSCTEIVTDETVNCPAIACTEEFRTVSVKFKDAAGNPLIIKNFSAIVRRTGKATDSGPVDTTNFKSYYSVVTDNDTKSLSAQGDTIDVSAVNSKTGQKKTVQFVVSGGKCACHIEKISGPEEVVFE